MAARARRSIILASAAFCFSGSIAAAQDAAHCPERRHVLAYLEERLAELPIAGGLAADGGAVEVLTSADGGTWTILMTSPEGRSCLLAAGTSWETLPTAMISQLDPGA